MPRPSHQPASAAANAEAKRAARSRFIAAAGAARLCQEERYGVALATAASGAPLFPLMIFEPPIARERGSWPTP